MTRQTLPARRPSLGFTIDDPSPGTRLRFDVMAGFSPDGECREVFISCNKTTTVMDIAGRDIGTIISIALQHGASIAELAGAVTRDDHGKAQGVAGAVLDALAGMGA